MSTKVRARKQLTKVEENLYRDEDSGIFIWRELLLGKYRWKSTRETTIGLARKKVKDFRSNVSGEPEKVELRHSFGEAFDIVMAIEGGNSKKTLKGAKTHIDGHLRRWFMGGPAVPAEYGHPAKEACGANCTYLDEFERNYEEYWSAYKVDQHRLKPGRKLSHDRRFLVMALKRAKIKGWVTRDFEKKDFKLLEFEDSDIGRMVEEEELTLLLPKVKENPKLFLQVMIALFHGQRLREILHLKWSEIDFRNETITLAGKRVKTRKGRVVQIHERVLPLLKEWKKQSQGEFVFPAVHTNQPGHPVDLTKPQNDNSEIWKRVKTAAGVDCRFHDLRHTAVSNMLLDGIPMPVISVNSGASIKTIMKIYAHLDKAMRKKVKTFCGGKLVGWGT